VLIHPITILVSFENQQKELPKEYVKEKERDIFTTQT
jgi:hypothetical protein